MGEWTVSSSNEDPDHLLMTIRSHPDGGTISLHMPDPEAHVVSVHTVERLRRALGAAIADAQANPDERDNDGRRGISQPQPGR